MRRKKKYTQEFRIIEPNKISQTDQGANLVSTQIIQISVFFIFSFIIMFLFWPKSA